LHKTDGGGIHILFVEKVIFDLKLRYGKDIDGIFKKEFHLLGCDV